MKLLEIATETVMKPAKKASTNATSPKPFGRRSGNCSKRRSPLRPVPAVVPSFLAHPESGLKGFSGFAERHNPALGSSSES